MRYISSVILAITLGVKAYGPLCSVSKNRVSLLVSASLIPLDENVEKPLDTNNDFAALMSKPLPEWYKDEKEEESKQMIEQRINRERIIVEFKAKYDISEEAKRKLREADDLYIESRAARRKEGSWFKRALGLKVNEMDDFIESGTSEERQKSREKWLKFREEESEESNFRLPGFFEVFPELIFKWPKWSKDKDGKVKKCKTDQDCLMPQACCPHPILPGDKFCCTGFNDREMIAKYQEAYIDP